MSNYFKIIRLKDLKNPNFLFEDISLSKVQDTSFWGKIPSTFIDGINLAKRGEFGNPIPSTISSRFKEVLIKYHKKLGIYTPKVKYNLELIKNGSILMGQQPVVFGGPGFIGNKFACLIFLQKLAIENDFPVAPIFFIGDYDGIQKELTHGYFPNPISHNAMIFDTDPYLQDESDEAAHAAKLPPIEWVMGHIDKFEANLRGFKKKLKGPQKKIFDERWDHIKSIITIAFTKSTTLSEWAARIWGFIINIIGDYGIIFLPTSHPEIRKLVVEEYHDLIIRRKQYAKAFLNAMQRLEEFGYKPSLPHRHDNYAPFTLECKGCNHSRVATTIREDNGELFAEGKCNTCNQFLSHKVTTKEDLHQIATFIGPRVDTSQLVFQRIANIKIRISGPGEIAYYGQVVPALHAIGKNTPVFIKYKRGFYNTNWNEELARILDKRGQNPLQRKALFDLLKMRVKAIKENANEEIKQAELLMHEYIYKTYEDLEQKKLSTDILKYLGWQYGKFDQFKFGQEVSWLWIDMALQTGLRDYIASYIRMYHPQSIIGKSNYINSSI